MIDQLRTTTVTRNRYLLRVGVCGETVRCLGIDQPLFKRGDQVVLDTDRGDMLAKVMQQLPEDNPPGDAPDQQSEEQVSDVSQILRLASEDDLQQQQQLKLRAEQDFKAWADRIEQWKVEVELVDLEWTLDGEKLILYVLNSRGPECTKLAMQAHAQGLGVIDVVPVSATGVSIPPVEKSGGGCGSGGCGSGGCSK
ncbi:MAG: hypothetical protein JKY95_17185 [Planctomycetaceae bacterium]|nr:hypothetical protein [Planctomycetaceae bacterium]